jgi:hypothetical protein
MQMLQPQPLEPAGVTSALRSSFRDQPGMAYTGILAIAMVVASVLGAVFDPKVITGEAAWVKPAKFGISFAVYAASLIWMLSLLKPGAWVRWAGILTAVGFTAEAAIIVLQVLRGVRSHFNQATPFDNTLYLLMAAFVGVIWLGGLTAAILVWRSPKAQVDPTLLISIKYGVVLMLIGALLAGFMTVPTSKQLALEDAGKFSPTSGTHTFGAPEDGPQLPFVGWSTVGGDGRVAHFVGLHALQILPLVGWWISRRSRWSTSQRNRLAILASLGYGGVTALLAWQAQRGQSIVSPDALTLTAFAVGVVLLVLGCVATLLIRGSDQPRTV